MSTDFVKSKVAGSPWWLVLMEGIAALILGILLLLAPGKALVALMGVVGLYFLVRGILYIVEIFRDQTQWLAKLIAGVLCIIIGIIVGGMLGGVLGILLAAPTIASGVVLTSYIYHKLLDLPPWSVESSVQDEEEERSNGGQNIG